MMAAKLMRLQKQRQRGVPGALAVILIMCVIVMITIALGTRNLSKYRSPNMEDSPHIDGYLGKDKDTSSHHQSLLLSMASISKDEYDVIPGAFHYGVSDNNETRELIITSASITGDYHNPDALWFQLLGMGAGMFEDGSNFGICKNRTINDTTVDNITMKPLKESWMDMKVNDFFCRIGERESRLLLMPSDSYDGNTVNQIQVFRCPLRGIEGEEDVISAYDMDRLRQHTQSQSDLALSVEVIHKAKGGRSVQVVKIVLSVAKPSVGIHKTLLDLPVKESFLMERHNMTLCIVAHANRITHLNEFLRYHYDIAGIDHIHLGLFTNFGEGNRERAEEVHYAINNLLFKSDVSKGALFVSPLWDEDFDVQCTGKEFSKLSFYQECLYRAKGTSEFVGTWDLDEFFLYINTTGSMPSIPDFLRAIIHPKCQNWSYVTMSSSTSARVVPDDQETGLVLLDHPTRGNTTNHVWLKSIAQTEKCFQNSPHILG